MTNETFIQRDVTVMDKLLVLLHEIWNSSIYNTF